MEGWFARDNWIPDRLLTPVSGLQRVAGDRRQERRQETEETKNLVSIFNRHRTSNSDRDKAIVAKPAMKPCV
jgi:hypothetical protein